VREPFEDGAHIDLTELGDLTRTAVRMLDNAIDVSRFPLPEQKAEAIAKRRIGLGVTGLADALIFCRTRYGSPESVAMIDGWQRGFAGRLTTRDEYLSQVGSITDIPTTVRTFSSRILDFQPNSWVTHVSGHPPGALLTFVWLDRIGLHGGAWAGLLCLLAGSSATAAVLVAVRALADEQTARRAAPFVVVAPTAITYGAAAG